MNKIAIFIMGSSWSQDSRRSFEVLSSQIGVQIELVTPAVHSDGLPVNGHYTKAIYYRLGLAALVDTPRAIYMDSDIISLRPIAPLLQADLKGGIVGAVEDLFVMDRLGVADTCLQHERIQLGGHTLSNYFNAGLLVVDAAAWRDNEIESKCIQFLQENQHLTFLDQDALNVVLRGRWATLDPRWNVLHYSELRALGEMGPTVRSLSGVNLDWLEREAYLLHFAGPVKPWHDRYPVGRNRDRFEQFFLS